MDFLEKDLETGLEPYELIRPRSDHVEKANITGDIRISFIEDDKMTDGFALLPTVGIDKAGEKGSYGADVTINVKHTKFSYVDGRDGKASLSFLLAHEIGHVLGLDDKAFTESNSVISLMNQSHEGENVLGRKFSQFNSDTGLYGNANWEVQHLRMIYSNATKSLNKNSGVKVEKDIAGNVGSLIKYGRRRRSRRSNNTSSNNSEPPPPGILDKIPVGSKIDGKLFDLKTIKNSNNLTNWINDYNANNYQIPKTTTYNKWW